MDQLGRPALPLPGFHLDVVDVFRRVGRGDRELDSAEARIDIVDKLVLDASNLSHNFRTFNLGCFSQGT